MSKNPVSIEAAIDIGTNTMLLLVAEVEDIHQNQSESSFGAIRKIKKVLAHELRFIRLGEKVHQNRFFIPEAMNRAMVCFEEYKRICDSLSVKKIHAVATSASRDSSNSKEFYQSVFAKTGIHVSVIPGEQEANLSFIGGLLPNQDPYHSAILDIGGGSTEFVTLQKNKLSVQGQSLDIGCVRATEMFLKGDPYSKSSVEALEKFLKKIYEKIDFKIQEELREKEWVAIAGTPTTLAAMNLKLGSFDPIKIDGYRLDRCTIADWFEVLATMTQAQREANPLMGKGRSDIMVAGVGILLSAMEFFGKEDVVVSSRGLREGVLLAYR